MLKRYSQIFGNESRIPYEMINVLYSCDSFLSFSKTACVLSKIYNDAKFSMKHIPSADKNRKSFRRPLLFDVSNLSKITPRNSEIIYGSISPKTSNFILLLSLYFNSTEASYSTQVKFIMQIGS